MAETRLESALPPGFWVSTGTHNKNKFIFSLAFKALDAFTCLTLSQQLCEVEITSLISQGRKLRLRVGRFAQGHEARSGTLEDESQTSRFPAQRLFDDQGRPGVGGAQALAPGCFQNGGGLGVSNAPAPSVHLPPSSSGHPGGGRGWNGDAHVTADMLARDAKRRARCSPCLMGNVVL